jgi:hypothetical protein
MPTAEQDVERPEPAELTLDRWNRLLYAHFFDGGQSKIRTPVSRLHVSGKELTVAIMADEDSVESVRTAFVECIKRSIGSRPLAVDALRKREAWFRTGDGVPSYFSHLLLTCMVANDLGASDGTQRCFYGLDTAALGATLTRRSDGTQLPRAATSGSDSDIRTDTVSRSRADRSQAVPYRRPLRARSRGLTSRVSRRTRRSHGTRDLRVRSRPIPQETVFPDSVPRLGCNS